MGEPEDVWRQRIELLMPYQVNAKTMALTSKGQQHRKRAFFLHAHGRDRPRETSARRKEAIRTWLRRTT
jgi:hypothetical protein